MAASQPISPVSSSSSLPSLASRPSSCSISELDNSSTTTTQQQQLLQPQPTPITFRAEITPTPTHDNNNNNTTCSCTQKKQQRLKRPFQSFKSLSSNGPFQKAQFHIITTTLSLICCCVYLISTVSASNIEQQRRLDEEDNDDGWTGEWNGEWTANDDVSYICNDDNGCISTKASGGSDSSNSNSMWLDGDASEGSITPDQIILGVSLGLITFMTLLCCFCYPELLMLGYNKICCGKGNNKGVDDVDGEGGNLGGDYVREEDDVEGGKKKKKKKRMSRKSSSRSRSGSRSKRSSSRKRMGDVELV